jgi:hypothetical protein
MPNPNNKISAEDAADDVFTAINIHGAKNHTFGNMAIVDINNFGGGVLEIILSNHQAFKITIERTN